MPFSMVFAYNQSMSFSDTHSASTGATPVEMAMAGVREQIEDIFTAPIPPGCEKIRLEQSVGLHREMERVKYLLLTDLAGLEATGALLEEGGQRTIQAWITHRWGTSPAEAHSLATLARALHRQQLPLVEEAFQGEVLSLGEACAIATSTEKATADWVRVWEKGGEEFQATHPDVDEYRARLEYGLIAYKGERPNVSVRQLRQATQWFVARLDPDKADREYDESFEERGAQFAPTFESGFLLRMWGDRKSTRLNSSHI